MLEPITFPVRRCTKCARDVLVAVDANAADELVQVCTRCGSEFDGASEAKAYASSSLGALGYQLGDDEGCGSGGCGSCGSGDADSASA